MKRAAPSVLRLAVDSPMDRLVPEDEPSGLDLRAMLAFALKARWFILAGIVVGIAFTAVRFAMAPPQFTASATVLFSPQPPPISSAQSRREGITADSLGTQVQILSSTSLMTRVVTGLSVDDRAALGISGEASPGPLTRALTWFDWTGLLPWALFDTPRPDAGGKTDRAHGADQERLARLALSDRLRFWPIPDSRVIRISFSAQSASHAANVVNAVAEEYITAQLDAKLSATRGAARWLTERVEELRMEVEAAEAAVATYSHGLSRDAGHSATDLEGKLEALNVSLAKATAERASLTVRHQTAQAQLAKNSPLPTLSDFATSDVISRYRQEAAEVAGERARLSGLVQPGHARLAALDARLDHLNANIRNEAKRLLGTLLNEVEIARLKEAHIEHSITTLRTELQTKDEGTLVLRQLMREAEASRLIYETFLARLKETAQRLTLSEADAVILSRADRPMRSNARHAKAAYTVFAALGALLGLGVAVARDRLNATLRTIEEAREVTGRPVLGTIPSLGEEIDRKGVINTVIDTPTSAIAEGVRKLRTALLFSNIDNPPQVVVVTSSVPGEGKSTTGLALALSACQIGKTAIMVDCDLRSPSVNDALGKASDAKGLPAVLEKRVDLDAAISVEPRTGLHVLAGTVSHAMAANAADIVSSQTFRTLIAALRERYDLVVLDAPPAVSLTDAAVIADLADLALYCVRLGETPREAVLSGIKEVCTADPHSLGLVLTMADLHHMDPYGTGAYGQTTYGARPLSSDRHAALVPGTPSARPSVRAFAAKIAAKVAARSPWQQDGRSEAAPKPAPAAGPHMPRPKRAGGPSGLAHVVPVNDAPAPRVGRKPRPTTADGTAAGVSPSARDRPARPRPTPAEPA
ncbi:MAG: AAA family ATPase [Pseudomonadota bacterium]